MLGLTKKTEYALIALSHLARASHGRTSAREIADCYNVPLPLLMNILKTLTQAGVVESTRGAHGGYGLATPAEEISLEDVIRAVEGVVSLTQCTADDGGSTKGICDRAESCPVRSPVLKINQRFRDFLSRVTVAEIADAQSATGAPTQVAMKA